MSIKRGDIFYVDLNPTKGSEQAGRRPVLVIQNNVGNEAAPTVIIAPLTTKKFSKEYPTNVQIKKGTAGLKEDSTVLLSQIRTIDKDRIERKVGSLSAEEILMVDEAIKVSLGLA
ncbi:MAG: type II toxin-antitoxin system PemK/MazF family toxin [Candidatus Omnitrophota bacterium]|nr:type II toxin-antitoxin system PemK/MazF family toxin [Candidatus Omnitrophota bacterium]